MCSSSSSSSSSSASFPLLELFLFRSSRSSVGPWTLVHRCFHTPLLIVRSVAQLFSSSSASLLSSHSSSSSSSASFSSSSSSSSSSVAPASYVIFTCKRHITHSSFFRHHTTLVLRRFTSTSCYSALAAPSSSASSSLPLPLLMSKLSDKLSIDSINVANKRVFLRVDFNVPLKDGKIKDTNRIDEALPTIEYLLKQKPSLLLLASHLGRPDGRPLKKASLAPLLPYLSTKLGLSVIFAPDCVGKEVQDLCSTAAPGSVILLENLRFHVEEEGKGKDEKGAKIKASKQEIAKFRQELTSLADIYVNDAFGTAHRAHSSMVGIQLPIKAAGFLLAKELRAFAQVIESPSRPFVAILGGAKVADKIQLIDNLLDKVDIMIIGGGMAYTFKKVRDDMKIGKSLFDEKGSALVPDLLKKAAAKKVQILLPSDFVQAAKFDAKAENSVVTDKQGIKEDWMGLDIGPASSKHFASAISQAKTVVLNGPMGVFEFPAFAAGTKAVLEAMVKATETSHCVTIVGGGDSASAAKDFGYHKRMTHVSTGGGASLELLEGKVLPGVMALSNKNDVQKPTSKL